MMGHNEGSALAQEIESAIPELMAKIKQETLTRIEREATQEATAVALKAARDWAVEHLAPEITAQLNANKAGIVASAEAAAKSIGDALAVALAEQASKALSNTYNVRSIAEAIFKGY